MGQVWLAERTEPVHRLVALKLIRAGMIDSSVAKRFYSERQSLAIMDHPAIAKVFDALSQRRPSAADLSPGSAAYTAGSAQTS